jgi:hypothetical protein
MPHVKHQHEEWAIAVLDQIVVLSRRDRDALPGSVVRLVKDALTILKKRRKE